MNIILLINVNITIHIKFLEIKITCVSKHFQRLAILSKDQPKTLYFKKQKPIFFFALLTSIPFSQFSTDC